MHSKVKVLLGLGLLAAAPASFSDTPSYNVDLTGVGTGNVADGVYVSPYQGTVQGNGMNYSGYLICDDFTTESLLNTPWYATMTAAGALNGTEKFGGTVTFDNVSYSAQPAYNAAGWLANGLLMNLSNSTAQDNYAFAIWDLFDAHAPNPAGGAASLEQAAFAAVAHGYTASNVSVLTASPNPGSTQEFLMVRPAPEMDPAVGTAALTLLLGGALVFGDRRKQQG